MPTFDPSDLIGRTFLLPPEENGERHRAKVTRQVVEIIDQDNGQRVENINFILDIGNGKVEELISYNQLLEHLENAQDHDRGMDQELYRFRSIIGHQGPLLASDPDWKGSKYNVQVEQETGEITFEPLSIIAADDPVTCAAYAKENDLLALEGWRRFRSLAKKDKVLARAIKQSKIRQVRRSQTYMFGYLIPRNYMEAMQFDSENKNSKWYDAIKLEMESMSEYKVVEFWGLPPLIPLLQYVNRLGFEICSVNRMNNRTRKLGYVNLNWPRCSAWVTESLALTDGSFCQKQNTLYFRSCKSCKFMMCVLIVDHQFNHMHPLCS